jgi:thymidylate kinase
MKERAQYIHIEGMDLAGKTTATHNFIDRTGRDWDVRRNSIVPENPIYLLADSLRRADAYDAEVLGNLYVAALMGDIRTFEWPDKDTIQDSTILLRSIAFHTVKGTPRVVEVLQELAPKHPKFDASFVFTADIETRLRRLQSRMDNQPEQVSPEDLLVIDKPEMFMAMEAALIDLARNSFHSVIIDTSTLTPDAVVQKMFDELPHLDKK